MPSLVDPSRPADGVVVSKTDFRNTFATIKKEIEHGGFFRHGTAALERRVGDRLREIVSVTDFGAKGDGTTDDLPAFQAAIAYLRTLEATSKTLLIPWSPMGYRLHGRVSLANCHGLTVEGQKSRIFGTLADRPPISTWHPGSLNDRDLLPNDHNGTTGEPFFPVIPLQGVYRPGQAVVTLARLPGPTELKVGDYIFIRTGDVARIAPIGVPHPIAEYNQVAAINGRSITLRWPLVKTYRYMGDTYRVNNVDYPMWFGVSVIGSETRDVVGEGIAPQDLITRDVTLRGLRLHHDTMRAAHLFNFIGLRVQDCLFSGNSGPAIRGRFLDLDFRTELKPVWGSWRPYHLALDCGTSDATFNVRGTSTGAGVVHLHEGLANLTGDIHLTNGATDPAAPAESDWAAVSIRSLSWGVHLRSVTVINSPLGPAVSSSPSSPSIYPSCGNWGLVIDRLRVAGRVNGQVLAHTGGVHDDGFGHPPVVIRSIDTDALENATGLTGSGWVTPSSLSQPLTLSAWATPRDPVSVVADNEVAWRMDDQKFSDLTWQGDVPATLPFVRRAMLELEVENSHSSPGDCTFRFLAVIGPAGTVLDMSGTPNDTSVLRFTGTGQTRFFRRMIELGANGRLGFILRRDATNGALADTLTGSALVRRARVIWMV